MVKGVRKEFWLGEPLHQFWLGEHQFTTNRMENINQLLKLETNKEKKEVYVFTKCMENAVKRQQRNIEWAVIGKGPYKLHPRFVHLQIDEKPYGIIILKKRDNEIARSLNNELKDMSCEPQAPQELHGSNNHATSSPPNHIPSAAVSMQATNQGYVKAPFLQIPATNPLELLSSVNSCKNSMHPNESTAAIYKKAFEILNTENAITKTP